MSTLFEKVKTFIRRTKHVKKADEKAELLKYGDWLKKTITNSRLPGNFIKSLLIAVTSAISILNTPAEAESIFNLEKLVSKIDLGIEKASEILNNATDDIITYTMPNKKTGVIGKGLLFDGNKFLEYADGGKLVYRSDLGNKDKTTYFVAGSRYKGKTWDDAIEEIYPIAME